MKNIPIVLSLVILFTSASNYSINAQTSKDSININYQSMAAEYSKKSRSQKRASTILGSAGVISGLIGLGLGASSLSGLFDPTAPPAKNYGSAPDILMIGGAVLIGTAIPISLAARKNKKLAKLYMKKENVMLTPATKAIAQITSVGIKIGL
jgi:hypothetical protein